MVINYQENREYLVLSLVKKYPFYSLDKLAKELPGISRHSIQRILEKNNLSTVEKRLAHLSSKERMLPESIKTRFQSGFLRRLILEGADKIKTGFSSNKQEWLGSIFLFVFVFFVFWGTLNYFTTKTPEIGLDKPEVGHVNKGENVFVSGKVFPRQSRVTINGKEVALNGDGSFTAIIGIPLGESVLELKAQNRGKKSQLLRLINREMTEEETRAKAKEDEIRKKEAADKAAEIDRTVNDLLAAKNAGKKGVLKVLNNKINEQTGFSSVVGEIVNIGKDDVGWVTVSVNFYSKDGNIVDTKYGFVATQDQTLGAGQTASFETQSTTRVFDRYSLDLSWEPIIRPVAGTSTINASDSAGNR